MTRGGETWRPRPPPPPLWKRLIGDVAAIVLGGVLLYASYAKVIDPIAFMELIAQEGLDFLLPAWIVAPIALALEGGIGLALVLGLRRWWVLLPATMLIVFFVFLTARAYYQAEHGIVDPAVSCGCFGNLVDRTPQEAFWQDFLLMVPALVLSFVGRYARSDVFPLGRVVVVGVFVAAVLGFGAIAPEIEELDDLATRLKPEKQVDDICAGHGDDRVCLDLLLPDLAEGEHMVVIANLRDKDVIDAVDRLNAYWDGGVERGVGFWALSTAKDEEIQAFTWEQGASFPIVEAPAALLRPLYRRLPRSFLVRDGRVIETYNGLTFLDNVPEPSLEEPE